MHCVFDLNLAHQYESAMEPMGCGMDGYMELNPDWNGSLDAIAAAAACCMEEDEEVATEDTGVVAAPGCVGGGWAGTAAGAAGPGVEGEC